MNFTNPDSDRIRALLQAAHTLAVVGLSPKPSRPSFGVARSMQEFGYRIIPVRPAAESILGERVYPDLRHVPVPIDIVNVFRAPQYVDAIVDDCIELQLPALWLQEGVINEAAAERARRAGIMVVMDRCIYKAYRALLLES